MNHSIVDICAQTQTEDTLRRAAESASYVVY